MAVTVSKSTNGVVYVMTAEAIRDALLSLPENERQFIISNPESGEYKILAMRRNVAGNIEYDYE